MKYLITGTSSGLGYELASELIKNYEVVGISRNIRKSSNLLKSKKFKYVKYDLSSFENKLKYSAFKKKIYKEIKSKEFTLIANAAQFYSGKKRLSIYQVKKMFDINVFSIIDLIKNLRKYKLKRVIIINSISGLIGQNNQHEYVSSKHALMGFVKSLIKDSKNCSFDVMCINPGGIKTELWKKYKHVNTETFIEPKELVKILVSLINLKQKLYIENMSILPNADI